MTDTIDGQIPASTLRALERTPPDRPVALLLRHSVRDKHLPSGDAGNALPITALGRTLARQLGAQLGTRLQTLHTSPLVRCVETAEALQAGAGVAHPVVPDRLLGDPGVYVVDGRRAWSNWQTLGHEGVMAHLVSASHPLPGMARPDEAARLLVRHMLKIAGNVAGIHVFVTHDSLVTATAARLLEQPLDVNHWPGYLEGAFFWQTKAGLRIVYRDRDITRLF